MRKFKIGDLVTVVKDTSIWYTHLDDIRLKKLGRTGRVVKVSQVKFTSEDMEWYRKSLPALTVYDCTVLFPDEPDAPICFSEIHLKAFEMPERK